MSVGHEHVAPFQYLFELQTHIPFGHFKSRL